MERNTYLSEERFQILPAHILLGRLPDFIQNLTASNARFSVHPRKGLVVVPWLKIVLLLLAEL